MEHRKQKKMIHSALAIPNYQTSRFANMILVLIYIIKMVFASANKKIQFLIADNTLLMKRGTAWVTQHSAAYAELH